MKMNKVNSRHKSKCLSHAVKPKLLAIVTAQALAFQAAQAANIEVTSSLDDGTDCTLREALATVNAGADQLTDVLLIQAAMH